mmetsp:Transcript_69623/g.96812  ORF Transcript_69623/g.96812 Transcript_69623/m.96812 type:complete len:108 (-) Transcript_69623:203-526(-)
MKNVATKQLDWILEWPAPPTISVNGFLTNCTKAFLFGLMFTLNTNGMTNLFDCFSFTSIAMSKGSKPQTLDQLRKSLACLVALVWIGFWQALECIRSLQTHIIVIVI